MRRVLLALLFCNGALGFYHHEPEDHHWIRANHHWDHETKDWIHLDHEMTEHQTHSVELSDGFEMMDKDKDGHLTEEEIHPHTHDLYEVFGKDHGGNPDGEHRWHVSTGPHWIDLGPLATWDENGDGKVSEEEYLNFAEPRMQARRTKRDFWIADKNKDGKLNYEEFRHSVLAIEIVAGQSEKHRTAGNEVSDEAALAHTFAKLDENHDHKISPQEYVHSLHSRDQFSRKDANGDGKLTKEEYVTYEHHHGLHHEDHAHGLFDVIDRSKDGFLTRLEHNKKGIDFLHHMSTIPNPTLHEDM